MYRTIDKTPGDPKTRRKFSNYRAWYTGAALQNTTLMQLAESQNLSNIIQSSVDENKSKYNSFYTYSANYPSIFLNHKLCILVKFGSRERMLRDKPLLLQISENESKCDLFVFLVQEQQVFRFRGNMFNPVLCESYNSHLERR